MTSAGWVPPEVASASWTPPEVANAQAGPTMDPRADDSPEATEAKAETGAGEAVASLATGGLASVPAGIDYLTRSAIHGVGALIGYSVAGGDPQKSQQITNWLTRKHDEDRQAFDDIANFWTYSPRTSQGRALTELPGQAASAAAHAVLPENAAETALQVGGDVLRGAAAVPTLKAIPRVPGVIAGARAAQAADAAAAAEAAAPKPAPPSPAVTAEQLRAQPNPIPPPNADSATAPETLAVQKPKISPKAGESAQAAATRQGITAPAAQEAPGAAPSAPDIRIPSGIGSAQGGAARLFHPPQEDGPQYATKASESEQAARRDTLGELNRLGGGTMSSVRRGAVSGDWEQTGNEHQTAKIPDAPGQLIRDQIASEHQALHNATQGVADSVGSVARNDIDRDTLEQRGDVVRDAIQGIEDHFNRAANGMYSTARAVLGDRPMADMPRVQQILSDASHDVNPTAAALRRAAQTKLQQLWTVGDTRGSVRTAPGTVGAAERFHEFLNESYHNDSAGLIRKLKNATDMDVAERAGGNDMFQAARNVIQHRETMLEPDGVNELRRPKDRNKIDHEVPIHEVMDHVTGQDREHFEHFMNVLRAGAHLSPEIAERSAAAIREIQGHMVARLHTAARGEAGAWNAGNFYKAANRFSTNMPSAFRENPALMERLQTINRAGNILKMDKSYPGAVAQAAKVGLIPSLAQKAIKAGKGLGEVGGVAHGNIAMAAAAHLGGKALEKGVESLTARSRLATARESLEPLGAKVGGGKQRGAVGDLSQRDAIEHDTFGSEGASGLIHTYTVPGEKGQLKAVETPVLGVRKSYKAEVDPDIRGQGWGTRMLQRAVDDAHGAGQIWHSDDNVSKGQVNAYKNLARLGYRVTEKGNTKHPGSWQAWGDHVFEVRPRTGGPGSFERGSVHVLRNNEFERAPERTPLSELPPGPIHTGSRPLTNNVPTTQPRGYTPGEPVPMGQSLFGGRQRGYATVNVGLHQGTEGEPGFRKMSKQEVVSALRSQGVKVSKTSVTTPEGGEPTLVADTDRALTGDEMQKVLARTKQSAIPQRDAEGNGTMHVAPGHEQIAKEQGWDTFNPDYFREHDGRTMTEHATEFNPEELEIHPNSTVKNPQRSAYPGIYDDPKQIMSRVKTAPENPIMKELFGVTRKDLHNVALSRGDVAPKSIPGVKETARSTGSKAAKNAMTPENADRLRNTIAAFKDHDESAYHGMVGWYVMDPLHKAVQRVLGKGKTADAAYSRLNTLMGMASPGSDVMTEIKRGTAAHMMASQDEFSKFQKFGGKPEGSRGKPPELANVPGHPYHSTAQAVPMRRYLETGAGAQAPKTSMYIASSEQPKSPGFQNKVLVGDSHFSRGFGLSDVRTARDYSGSIEGPELRDLHPWYHEHVAKPSGLPGTSAQAVQWGALSHETGVETPVGAPKLELFAQQVKVAAQRLGITPKEALTRIIKGIAHAG